MTEIIIGGQSYTVIDKTIINKAGIDTAYIVVDINGTPHIFHYEKTKLISISPVNIDELRRG